MTAPVLTPLPEQEWRRRAHEHERRVDGWLAAHRERARGGLKHPVEDFLFTYYSYRPAKLLRWHPGAGVLLTGASADDFGPGYAAAGGGVTVDTAAVLGRRRETVTWIHRLLVNTAARPAQLGCFGLHEWAMVYGLDADRVRHAAWPLRLPAAETARVVADRGVRCTHFDAFRFFTPAARPLNILQPTRESQPSLEQPGCLHATMDLYKWAYKLVPLVPAELVADCFALARDVRTLDMRASPYDLATLGYDPVRIETPEGRAEYATTQRAFVDRAAPLRQDLIDRCATLLNEPGGS